MMAEQDAKSNPINNKKKKWIDIPPTPPTTFPTRWFITYTIITLLLLPIHLCVALINGIYKLIMYLINKAFYFPCNRLLKPIKTSPSNFIIVTGAASGIGKDISLLFANKGFSLILIDISNDLELCANELKHKFRSQTFKHLQIDLSQSNAAATIYETIICEWKLLDIVILVNNAGFGMTGDFLNHNVDKLKRMVAVNSIVCMELAHKFGRYFVQRGVGRICQIASVAAFVPGLFCFVEIYFFCLIVWCLGSHSAAYHATKAFSRNMAMALQHELIGTGVGVTCVCPGPVNTKFVKASNAEKSNVFGALNWFAYEPLDVAKAAVNATLNGKREVVHGPLWLFLMNLLSFYGETYNIISAKFFWQDPNSKYRSPYKAYAHAEH